MSIKHWMSAPIAVATLFASQLFLVDAPLAAEEKDFIDPRNDVFEQNHPESIPFLEKQHPKVSTLKML